MPRAIELSEAPSAAWRPAPPQSEVDVCLIVEGCYPYRRGGVSNWVDTLLRDQPDVSFTLISIQPPGTEATPLYALPPNLRAMWRLQLGGRARHWREPRAGASLGELAAALIEFCRIGGVAPLRRVSALTRATARGDDGAIVGIAGSRLGWEIACTMYREIAPSVSFRDFYWSWRALIGGLFEILACPLPPARIFHTASTGFAGLLAARAALETGRPALLTEHGIYTNERLIEVLAADWLSDDIDLSLSVDDRRVDLRSFWTDCFESYARTCYQASSAIIGLFSANQAFQRELGADPAKLRVIPNGVDWRSFAELPTPAADARPTVALIGRVVPCKDIKTFLFAVRSARERVADLCALVLGDVEEDAAYAAQCRRLADELGLAGCVEFTGVVDVRSFMPRLQVVVLTSLTESQPLAILEAGAAAIPCVATDVGACREMLLGVPKRANEGHPGGIVTRPLAPLEIADAIVTLLADPDLRRRCGRALQARVRRHYDRDGVRRAYAALYHGYCRAPHPSAAGAME
jgi:glycosyltransferase involved in cell wall biosynthesis